jgi:hypothetical protein
MMRLPWLSRRCMRMDSRSLPNRAYTGGASAAPDVVAPIGAVPTSPTDPTRDARKGGSIPTRKPSTPPALRRRSQSHGGRVIALAKEARRRLLHGALSWE